MINYSTCMRGNPTDKDAAKKAYANAQYSQVMTLDKFCYHTLPATDVYTRAPISKPSLFLPWTACASSC